MLIRYTTIQKLIICDIDKIYKIQFYSPNNDQRKNCYYDTNISHFLSIFTFTYE